jgi:hypothetical protein
MYKHAKTHVLTLAIGLALGASGAHAALLGGLVQSLGGIIKAPTTTQSTASARNADIAKQAQALSASINTLFPSMGTQATASPLGIYQLYHASLHSPLYFLQQFPLPLGTSGPQAFMNAFPSPTAFADWLALLQTDPNAAAAQYAAQPGNSAATLASMNNATKMLGDRLPTTLASNLPVVGQMLAGLLGGGANGGGPLSTDAHSGMSHSMTDANGIDRMWCDVTNDGGILGRILRGALGNPVSPSPGGKGYGSSLLPYFSLGSSPTGLGFSQTVDYVPLLNSNQFTEVLRGVVTRSLPLMTPILPNNLLGLLTFRTYYTADRTGLTPKQTVPVNDPMWTAGAIDIGLPGLRLFTVEMICPGLNRHSVAATSPTASNPNYDPAAESNYTGYTNLDLIHRKITLSWGFGDGLVDDVWIYGHYVPWTIFGAGDTDPGMHSPAEHSGMTMP